MTTSAETWTTPDGTTHSIVNQSTGIGTPSGPQLALIALYGLAVMATIWLALAGIEHRARTDGDTESADRLRRLRLVQGMTAATMFVIVYASLASGDHSAAAGLTVAGPLVVLVLVSLLAHLLTIAALHRRSRHGWAQGTPRPPAIA